MPAPALAGLESIDAMRFADGQGAWVVALVRDAAGGGRIVAANGDEMLTLRDGPAAGAGRLERWGDGLLCLVPGGGLFRIRAGADGRPETRPLETGARLPDGVCVVDATAWGLFAGDGRWTFAPLAGPSQADDLAGPELSRRQRPRRLVRNGAGRLVLLADDAELGFHAWVRTDGQWRTLVDHGAARHAMNAEVLAAAPFGAGLVVGVGIGPSLHARLWHMPMRGELLRLDPEGGFDILCGELRTSPDGLKVPLAGARTPAARETRASFTHLIEAGPDLLAAQQRDIGTAAFYRLTEGLELVAAGEADGVVADLIVDAQGTPRALMAAVG